ncbi:MAG: response regulator [Blastocatellia bacterium]|nr:response regulator [Blastocatellia bacterium]
MKVLAPVMMLREWLHKGWVPCLCGCLIVGITAITLGGWGTNRPGLTYWVRGLPRMAPNTALWLFICGLVLVLLSHPVRQRIAPFWVKTGGVALGMVGAWGIGTLLDHSGLTGWGAVNWLSWLVHPELRSAIKLPVLQTTLGVLFCVIGLSASVWQKQRSGRVTQFMALLTFFPLTAILLAYLYHIGSLYESGKGDGIAINTTIALLALAIGCLTLYPNEGFPAYLVLDCMSGRIARWLLPTAFLVYPLLGWGRLQAGRWGWFEPETGVAILITVVLTSFLIIGSFFIKFVYQNEKKFQQGQTELQDRELKFRTLSMLAPVGIFQTDQEGNCLFVNEAWQSLTSLTQEEALGKGWARALHPEDRERIISQWEEVNATSRVFSSEYRFLKNDGQVVWVSGRAEPMLNQQGQPIGYLGTVTDVSTHKAYEAQLLQASEVAVEGSQTKSAFLAMMSHEIRTPLNGVIGFTNLLLQTRLTEEQIEFVSLIRKSGESLLVVINDILGFSKLEAGKVELERIDFNPVQVVEDTLDLIADRLHQKHLEAGCVIGPDIPCQIRNDPTRLRQILLNIVDNAIKFTEQGGFTITLRVEGSPAAGRHLRFLVSDTGLGLTPEQQQRLFQPFSQADLTTTRKFGGTGLGLAICKQLVDLMGGQIGVESKLGVGASFWFRFPLETEVTGSEVGAPLPAKEIRAVCLTASPFVQTTVESTLTRLGMQVVTRRSIVEGVDLGLGKKLTKADVSLVVVDSQMVDGTAADFVDAWRATTTDTTIPLVYLTEYTQPENPIAAPASRHFSIRKPLKPSQLEKTVRRALAPEPIAAAKLHGAENGQGLPVWDNSCRILVAEDNPINQKLMLTYLKQLGLAGEVAVNGRDAYQAWASGPAYDLILMDCQMPIQDGIQTTQAIREQEGRAGSGRHIPIVAVSATAFGENRERCLAAGMDDFLAKPVILQDLATLLQRWLVKPAATQPKLPPQESAITNGAEFPVLDSQVLEQFSLLGKGDSNFINQLFSMFFAEAPRCLEDLRQASEVEDAVVVKQKAHYLKGMSASLGLCRLNHFCEQLELTAGANQQKDGILVKLIEKEITRVETQLKPKGGSG